MLIQLGKHHKIFGISTKVNSISCPNDNIHFSLVHMLDLDIIVAGIDNIHATNCIFWEIRFSGILNIGGESDLRYSLLTMTTQVARFPQTPTTRKMLKVKYCFLSSRKMLKFKYFLASRKMLKVKYCFCPP